MHTLAEARDNLAVTGCGEGVWEEQTAEKEKWGSGSGKGEAKGEQESGRTDEPEGVDRKVWGGQVGGELGRVHVESGTEWTELATGDGQACKKCLDTGGCNWKELACIPGSPSHGGECGQGEETPGDEKPAL